MFISEYTGGGFGSKITGAISLIIPALLSKKANAPVMMRISREEEHYIGRARPSLHGRMKVGFTKEGRITALDMFVICDNGPYDPQGDAASSGRIVSLLYQPQAMRWRGVTVLTNTPPRSVAKLAGRHAGHHAHGADPGQSRAQAGHRSGGDPPHQLPRKAKRSSDRRSKGKRQLRDQRVHQGSARPRRGAVQVGEREARSRSAAAPRCAASACRCSCFVGGSIGFDGLFVIKPDGRSTSSPASAIWARSR